MALDGLYPSFVRIHYTSEFAPHVQTIPTRQWTGDAGSPGTYLAWDGVTTVNADEMVEAMITAELANNPDTTTFTYYEIFDVPVIDEPPVWKFAKFLSGQVGTLVATGQAAAVQYTMSFKCADGQRIQIINLDTPVGNVWGNINGLSPRDADIAAELTNTTNAWQGRQGGQPITFTNITVSMNKKLRREYHMI